MLYSIENMTDIPTADETRKLHEPTLTKIAEDKKKKEDQLKAIMVNEIKNLLHAAMSSGNKYINLPCKAEDHIDINNSGIKETLTKKGYTVYHGYDYGCIFRVSW